VKAREVTLAYFIVYLPGKIMNKIVGVYPLEYIAIYGVFYTSQNGGDITRLICWKPQLKETVDLDRSYSKRKVNVALVSEITGAIM
jgi:hypothetical protein